MYGELSSVDKDIALVWPKLSILTELFEFYQFDRSISLNWTDKWLNIIIFTIKIRMHRMIVITVSSETWFRIKSLLLWPKILTLTEKFEFYQFGRSISPNCTDRRFGIRIFTVGFRMHIPIVITMSSTT
jgi:uncharacterized protein (DUF4213/DUF364 family)